MIIHGHTLTRDQRGRFIPGICYAPKTKFKKGEHWRKHRPHWDKEWLIEKYVNETLSLSEIGKIAGCTGDNIKFWLIKHGIPRRDVSQARGVKYWGVSGDLNPMHGKTGNSNPNWRGGITKGRQLFYSSLEWKQVAVFVWKRDKYTCQRCGIKTANGVEFHIHHIVSFSVIGLRADPSNLILVCKKCHNWIHSNENVDKEFIQQQHSIFNPKLVTDES